MDKCFLCQVSLFKSLPSNEITNLEKNGIEKRFSKGQSIIFEGDPVNEIFVVKEGRIKVVKYGSNGRVMTLHVLNPGDVFCEAAVLQQKVYPCNAIADEQTVLLGLRKQNFLQLIKKLPQFAQELINKLSTEVCRTHLIEAMGQEPVNKRIVNVLLSLSKTFGNTLPFTRQDISFMAGTTVETTIRVLSSLRKSGLVDSKRGKISLNNMQKLEELL